MYNSYNNCPCSCKMKKTYIGFELPPCILCYVRRVEQYDNNFLMTETKKINLVLRNPNTYLHLLTISRLLYVMPFSVLSKKR